MCMLHSRCYMHMHMHMHMHMYGFKAVHVMYGFTALKPYISVWGGGDFVQKGE